MIALGLRLRDLGTDRLTWSDLRAIVRRSPRSSALFRELRPDEAQWGLTEHLLAGAVDALRWLVWAKTKDGEKGRRRPEPLQRPGIKEPESRIPKDVVALPVDEVARRLKLPRRDVETKGNVGLNSRPR